MTEWTLSDWHEPDLDRGIIESKTLSKAEIDKLPKSASDEVFMAADAFAADADEEGIAVTASEWVLSGRDGSGVQEGLGDEA